MGKTMAAMILGPASKSSGGRSYIPDLEWSGIKVVKFVVAPIALGTAAFALWRTYKKIMMKKKFQEMSLEKPDVVILHQFPRGLRAPSISPFPLKLETYLRMTGIPYINDFKSYYGPKGKCPYITLNGEDMGDSQLIMEHLNKLYEKNLDSGISETDRAIGHAFRIMTENHLYWSGALYRWVFDTNKVVMKLLKFPFPLDKMMYFLVKRSIRTAAWYHGIGRHTPEEIMEMGAKDIRAISKFLGSKPYFLGDKPSEVDCAMFGFLAQLVWNFPDSPLEQLACVEYPNIKEYCFRMKATFWPDWDECLFKPEDLK